MNKMWELLEKIEQLVMILGMTAMIVLNFLNVVFRILLPLTPFSYSEELTIIIFMWVSLFGISYGFKVSAHTMLDVFTNRLPKKLQPVIAIIVTLSSVVFMIFIAYTSYGAMMNQIVFNQVTPGLRLPMYVNSGALLLGSIMSVFSVIRTGILEIKELREIN